MHSMDSVKYRCNHAPRYHKKGFHIAQKVKDNLEKCPNSVCVHYGKHTKKCNCTEPCSMFPDQKCLVVKEYDIQDD